MAKNEPETFDDLVNESCYTLVESFAQGRPLRSTVYTLLLHARQWEHLNYDRVPSPFQRRPPPREFWYIIALITCGWAILGLILRLNGIL